MRFGFVIIPSLCLMVGLTACRQSSDDSEFVAPQNRVSTPPTSPKTENLPPTEKALYQTPLQCYSDLCGSDIALFEVIPKAQVGSEAHIRYYQQHLEPRLKMALETDRNNSAATLMLIQKHQAQFQNMDLSAVQLRFLKSFFYILRGSELDKSLLRQINSALKDRPHVKASQYIQVKEPGSYVQNLHPGKSRKEALKEEVLFITSSQERINKALGVELLRYSPLAFARALAKEALDQDETTSLVNTSYLFRQLEDLTLNPNFTNLVESIPLTQDDFNQIFRKSSVLARLQKAAGPRPEIAASCERRFYMAMNLSPTKEASEQFQQTIEAVREAFLEELAPHDSARERIQKLQFLMPPTTFDMVKRWVRYFENSTSDNNQSIQLTKTYRAPEAFLQAATYALLDRELGLNCDSLFDIHLSDAIIPEAESSRLSWFSVRYPRYGIGILAHEMGHAVSSASHSYEQTKSCLREKQNTGKYTDEDFADWIAAKVENRLLSKMNLAPANVACALASFTPQIGLINPDEQDVHSSNLYRSLQVAIQKGTPIPKSCEELVRKENPKTLNRCN